jgi:hypothetical protein
MRTPADATHTEPGSGRTRTSGPRRLKVGLAAVVVFMATFAGLTAAGVSPAAASTLDGTATIANPGNDSALASGGSATQYTLTLPAGASCTGDTATDGYHVFSYLVREGTSPAAISFASGLPADYPDAPTGLFDSTGNYYGPANTAVSTGQIVSIPGNLEFAPMLSRGLSLSKLLYTGSTSGVWEAGIACANSTGAVSDYWNTEVTFTSSGSDPNGFVWADTPGPCVADSTVGFYSAASATFAQQTSNRFAAASTGCPTPAYTETGTLPAGVTLASSGLLSGSPTKSGSFPITLKASVSGGTPATQSFTLTVPVGVPYPPTGVSATGGSDSASVKFTAPTNNGGATITKYVVTATDTSDSAGTTTASGTASPITVPKLFGGDTYTFSVAAVNSVGTGTSSASTAAVTLKATVPAAPAAPKGTAGHGSVALTWVAPNPEGKPITGYVITPSTGTAKTVGAVTSYTFTGLTNGKAYTFTIAAKNSVGTSAASAKSASVTPNGLYIVTTTLPKATKGKKYTSTTLTSKNGVGKLTWKATGLPTGLTLSTAGVLSGTDTGAAKTYTVTVTVTDSDTPTKQTATAKYSLVVS